MKNVIKILVSFIAVIALLLGVNHLAKSIRQSNMYAKVEMDLEVGDIYFESNNFVKAAQVYEDILEHKFEVKALSQLALSYYNLGDYQNSLDSSNQLLNLDTTNTDYLVIKAQSFTGLGLYDEAVSILDDLETELPEVQVAYAKNNLAMGLIDQAQENAFNALEVDPAFEGDIVTLSDIYIFEENYTAATKVLSNGYELTKSKALLERIDHIALTFEDQ